MLMNGDAGGSCLDDQYSRTTNGNAIDLYPCNDTQAGQQWHFWADSNFRPTSFDTGAGRRRCYSAAARHAKACSAW
jgi:hypothetical protein